MSITVFTPKSRPPGRGTPGRPLDSFRKGQLTDAPHILHPAPGFKPLRF